MFRILGRDNALNCVQEESGCLSSNDKLHKTENLCNSLTPLQTSGVTRRGVGVLKHPPEILKALQNRAKLNPICENRYKLLNLGRQHPKMSGKKQ
jgi:hypothetical protein